MINLFLDNDTPLTPHGFCLNWDPLLLTWTIIGDGSIALAYALIPIIILLELRHRRLTMPNWVPALFASFIVLCGLSHVLMIYTLFHPAYWLETGEKVLTGAVSLFTAALLPFARPRSTALVEWWTRARELRHELNNLRQKYAILCERHGEPMPVWKDAAVLPLPPLESRS